MILKKLDYKKRAILIVIFMVFTVCIAYLLSFSKTISAIALNSKLTKEQASESNFDGTLAQTERKSDFYSNAVKAYTVKKQERETRLWQTISSLAVAEKVMISFNPDIKLEPDTNDNKNSIARQNFIFKGRYFALVNLLDTLHKTSKIGKISKLHLFSKKEDETENVNANLTMELEMVGVEK